MYSYKTGLGQVWVGAKLPPNPGSNIIWLRPSDDHRVLWEIRTYNIYKEKWEVLTSAALTAEGLLVLIRDLEKDVKSLQELKAVLYDTVQNLTPEQQQIARQNIGAISLEDLPPQVEVVQEVGTSTTNVMSQKAVTRELFALDTEIDNVKKELEEEISNAFNLEELEKHAVLYDKEQALSDDQKETARSNINAVGSSMIKGVEIVHETAPMQEDNILYIELEETT